MNILSPAKINLSLSVGSLRDDGFHEVDSFFHLLELSDVLQIRPANEFNFSSSADLGIPDTQNLVMRAISAMVRSHDAKLPNIQVHLVKNIPHGAGLGGGSSNAAAAIYALAKMWNISPRSPKVLEIAAQLGSDVPLFLAPTTASIMTGRGEVLAKSLEPLKELNILIVIPKGAHSPTAAVYRAFDLCPAPRHEMTLWENNLEAAACQVSPMTAQLLSWLRKDCDVEIAQVAGSGAACWALFPSEKQCKDMLVRAQTAGYIAFATKTALKGIHQIS